MLKWSLGQRQRHMDHIGSAMRLLADTELPGLEIDLDSWDEMVTLFGIVSSQDAKAAAEADALKVSGVKRVVK